MEFYHFCNERAYRFVDEPLFAYAMHMLCSDVRAHTLRETADLWASDWTGQFRDRLPDGDPWWFTDYFTEERFPVNPAIVHAMRSKTALIAEGKGCDLHPDARATANALTELRTSETGIGR